MPPRRRIPSPRRLYPIFQEMRAKNIGSCCTPPPFVEDGITATPTPAPGGLLPSETHFDISNDASLGASSGNRVGVIHRGNGGEQITFTFASGNFNLRSVAIAGWDLDGDPSLTGKFDSSSGAILSVDSSNLLTIDFTAFAGWSNISFFTFTLPVGVGTCNPANCAAVAFDNVVMTASATAPLPASLPLFVTGLAGLRWLVRRRKTAVEAA